METSMALAVETVDSMKSWIEQLLNENRELKEEKEALAEKVKVFSYHTLSLQVENLKDQNRELQEETTKLKAEVDQLSYKLNKRKRDESDGNHISSKKLTKFQKKIEAYLRAIAGKYEQEDGTPQKNPLLIAEVVRVLLQYVPASDVLTYRQVCKLWRSESKQLLQEKRSFRIPQIRLLEVRDFLFLAEESFPRFRNLELYLLSRSWLLNFVDIQQLLSRHGRYLKSLVLDFGRDNPEEWAIDDFRDLFLASLEEIEVLVIRNFPCNWIHLSRMYTELDIRKVLPKLTSFSIDVNRSFCPNTHLNSQVFIDLFNVAPNLERLKWTVNSYRRSDDYDGLRNILQALFDVNPPKFEALILLCTIPDVIIGPLINSPLRLKYLYLFDFKLFELRLAIPPFGKSEIIPKRARYFGVHGMELRALLEATLSQCGEASATALLHSFTSALGSMLNGALMM